MAILGILLSSVFDFPTLITIVGSMLARSLKAALLIALLAAVFGYIVGRSLSMNLDAGMLLTLHIPVQLILAFLIYTGRKRERRKKQQELQDGIREEKDLERSQELKRVAIEFGLFLLLVTAIPLIIIIAAMLKG